ncbi:MAG: Phosphate-binding protein PstS3 [Actinomycetota bacterium]
MSRNKKSTRGIVLAACAAAGAALLLSACTPPLPPDVLAAQAEANITCQTGAQNVSLPEDFAGASDAVNATLSGTCPDQSLVEVPAGDPAGLTITEMAPTADQVAAFEKTCPSGSIIVPVFGYPVVLALNVVGLEGLVLTPKALAGILDGSITSWTDPVIADANPGIDLTGITDITVMSLDHPSGAVNAMTAYLGKTAADSWTAGTVDTLSVGTKFPTTADLITELTATDGAVAVLPAVQAVNAALPMASVDINGTTISVDDTQLLKVGVGALTVTTDAKGNMVATPAVGGTPVPENFDAAAAKVVLADGQEMIGWPILGIAHMMVCEDGKDPLPLSSAQFLVRLAGQGSLETFGLTPLPEPVRVRTFVPLKVTAAAPSGAAAASAAASPAMS